MAIQSPKSQRSHAPGETPAEYDGKVTNDPDDGVNPERHAAGPTSPSVPSGLDRSPGKHQGNTEAESAVPTHPEAPHQGGGPGFAKDKGDGSKTGGSVHQT